MAGQTLNIESLAKRKKESLVYRYERADALGILRGDGGGISLNVGARACLMRKCMRATVKNARIIRCLRERQE